MVRSVTLFSDLAWPGSGPGFDNLSELTKELGMDALEQCWRHVNGVPLPDAVRSYVESWSGQ
jgi:hypothetical protein